MYSRKIRFSFPFLCLCPKNSSILCGSRKEKKTEKFLLGGWLLPLSFWDLFAHISTPVKKKYFCVGQIIFQPQSNSNLCQSYNISTPVNPEYLSNPVKSTFCLGEIFFRFFNLSFRFSNIFWRLRKVDLIHWDVFDHISPAGKN